PRVTQKVSTSTRNRRRGSPTEVLTLRCDLWSRRGKREALNFKVTRGVRIRTRVYQRPAAGSSQDVGKGFGSVVAQAQWITAYERSEGQPGADLENTSHLPSASHPRGRTGQRT